MTITLEVRPHYVAAEPHPARTSERLREAHREASECVGTLDLDDRRLWRQVDALTAAISTTAYELSASARGAIPDRTAVGVPPVVRARELACAQQRLFEDLARNPGLHSGALEGSAAEVMRLVRMIRECHARQDD